MRKFIQLVLFLGLCASVFAQNLHISENTYQKVAISFHSDSLSAEDVSANGSLFSRISMPDYDVSYNPGAPQLPLFSKLLQIPVCDSVVVTIVYSEYTEYAAADLGITHPIYPSQPSVSKSATNPPFHYDQTVYATDTFYALPLVSVEKAGIRRDIALANVYFSPVQYNPVTHRVRIYTRVDVEFTFANTDMAMTNNLKKYASPMFTLDSAMVINKMKNAAKNEFQGVPIKYLIIANSTFSSNTSLTQFVEWKRRLGYLVEVAYTSNSSVGTTTTSIKNFIQNKYNNATSSDPAPTFLLLIGDVAQIPAYASTVDPGGSETHYTDLYYSTLTGNDNIPDCYCGRLSATNATQLKNQLDKIMMYEQYTMPDPSYLGRAVLIAGTDNSWSPTHANGQINYASRYVYENTTATPNPYNFTTVYKHLHNCSSQAATIRSEIGAGVGFANYTAHGNSSGWYEPAFNTSHISSMSNANKYGLLIGNCCLTGKFDESECFAEALLRTANKGAMGYIGASKETYWDQDVYWAVGVRSNITANMSFSATNLGMYDKLFHTESQVAYSNWVSTIGGILQGGNLAVQSSSSSNTYKQYYWEIYHCFGDPSVRVYLGIPNTMTVTAEATIPVSSTTYTVHVPAYAYVALKKNTTEYVVAGFANASGNLTLTLPATIETGTYELVVLAQNYIPYFQNVEIVDDGNCAAPTTVNVTNITPFSATLSWTGTATRYNIGIRTASSDWTTLASNVTATTYPLTNLQDNTEYQVRVQSVCDNETSYWRNVSFSTPIACPIPTDLHCVTLNATMAVLSWTENGSANSWTLQYGTQSSFAAGTYTQVNVTSTSATLTGLTSEITYYARVRANCGGVNGNSQWSNVCTFLPSNTQTVEIGSGTGTSNYLPTNNYYNYSLTQQIYTAAELGQAGQITSIDFYKNATTSCNRNLDIYMVSTSKSSFSGGSDWFTVTDANKVFSGTVNFANNAWTTITLNTPFAYDGVHNVAIIVDDNTGSYKSNTPFLTFSASNQAIYIYSDNTNYNALSPSSYSGTAISSKNQIRITKDMGSCSTPVNVAVSNITGNSANISWIGEGDSYNIRYRETNTGPSTVILTAGNVWNDGSGYQMLLDADATAYGTIIPTSGGLTESGDASAATYAEFEYKIPANADGACTTSNIVYENSVSIQIPAGVYDWCITNPTPDDRIWIASANGNVPGRYDDFVFEAGHTYEFTVSLGESNDQVTLTETGSNAPWTVLNNVTSPYNLTGLNANTSYQVEVQANCNGHGSSAWSNTETFTTEAISIVPSYVHIAGENSVCQGHTTTLTASSDVPVTYHWSTGATTASITVPAGTYRVTVTSSSGNSLVSEVFTVTEKQNYKVDVYQTVCENELPYVWNGSNYTESGNYKKTFTAANGCDSIVTLHLTVNYPTHTAITVSECGSYTWTDGDGATYTTSGDHTYSHTDANGCTQVDTLHLTINNPVHTAITVAECGSYTWSEGDGQTYTSSGDHTYSHTDANGCTQVDTLHLTINNPVHTAVTVTECESYTWTEGNGQTYTTSGDRTYPHEDANGCTQVDTLHLTINNPTHTAVTESACGSYTWNGTEYTISGEYTFSHLDDNGCTQVDTLHLTINNPIHTAVTESACGSYTWNGTEYTISGE